MKNHERLGKTWEFLLLAVLLEQIETTPYQPFDAFSRTEQIQDPSNLIAIQHLGFHSFDQLWLRQKVDEGIDRALVYFTTPW